MAEPDPAEETPDFAAAMARGDNEIKNADGRTIVRFAVPDPAEIAYQDYRDYLLAEGDPGHAPKRWNELASVERKAWQAAHNAMRLSLLGKAHVPVPMPEPDKVVVTAGNGQRFASFIVDRELLADGKESAKMITDLYEKISEKKESNAEA